MLTKKTEEMLIYLSDRAKELQSDEVRLRSLILKAKSPTLRSKLGVLREEIRLTRDKHLYILNKLVERVENE